MPMWTCFGVSSARMTGTTNRIFAMASGLRGRPEFREELLEGREVDALAEEDAALAAVVDGDVVVDVLRELQERLPVPVIGRVREPGLVGVRVEDLDVGLLGAVRIQLFDDV